MCQTGSQTGEQPCSVNGCGAPATVRWTLITGRMLLLCSYHAREMQVLSRDPVRCFNGR